MTIEEQGDARRVERIDGPGEGPARAPAREPFLRAPWPAAALSVLFLALYGLQSLAGDPQAIASTFGFSPAALAAGRWTGLFTALFVHGGWPHVFLNSLGALAFGAPLARLFGRGAAAAVVFFGFFLVCGVVSSLGYAAVHWGAPYVLVGASGGVSGLMGAASRLIERRGALAPFTSHTVIGMAAAWAIVNVVIGWVGLAAISGGAPIAWEAHLVGYAVGLVLIGPVAHALGRA